MSHMKESCHIWMSHVTYEGVMSHMNESCHIWMSYVTYEWVTSHKTSNRQIKHVNESSSCTSCEWVNESSSYAHESMSQWVSLTYPHMWMSHPLAFALSFALWTMRMSKWVILVCICPLVWISHTLICEGHWMSFSLMWRSKCVILVCKCVNKVNELFPYVLLCE